MDYDDNVRSVANKERFHLATSTGDLTHGFVAKHMSTRAKCRHELMWRGQGGYAVGGGYLNQIAKRTG